VQTVTFYSYKGGSGRSLLLANAARFLALSGKRVVALDFDLEAPGLHYKLNIGTSGQRPADVVPERGVVDYILAANDGDEPERLEDYVVPVALPPGSGQLWLMPAGAAPSGDYWRSLTKIGKRGMLSDPDGMLIADFLELKFRLEEDLALDYLLIDARTGITELAGIGTTLLADTVVCLMLDNPESLAGSRAVLRSFGRALRLDDQVPIDSVPVLSRVPARDQTAERRVREYLTEPGPSSAESLTISTLYVLPEEPEAGQAEPSLLDRARESAGSTLGRGFMAIMRRLDPGLGPPTEALRRQQAADAMRARLTSGTLRLGDGTALRFRDDEIVAGAYLESGSVPGDRRYADLSRFSTDWHFLLVAEYVDDLSADDPRDWWLHRADSVIELILFTIDWEGRLQQRLMLRRTTAPPDAPLRRWWEEDTLE
jgi:hypothetical protein